MLCVGLKSIIGSSTCIAVKNLVANKDILSAYLRAVEPKPILVIWGFYKIPCDVVPEGTLSRRRKFNGCVCWRSRTGCDHVIDNLNAVDPGLSKNRSFHASKKVFSNNRAEPRKVAGCCPA